MEKCVEVKHDIAWRTSPRVDGLFRIFLFRDVHECQVDY
jgi:hypothetical protein